MDRIKKLSGCAALYGLVMALLAGCDNAPTPVTAGQPVVGISSIAAIIKTQINFGLIGSASAADSNASLRIINPDTGQALAVQKMSARSFTREDYVTRTIGKTGQQILVQSHLIKISAAVRRTGQANSACNAAGSHPLNNFSAIVTNSSRTGMEARSWQHSAELCSDELVRQSVRQFIAS